MGASTFLRYAIAVGASAAFSAGCASAPQSVISGLPAGRTSPQVRPTPVIYVSAGNEVLIYPERGTNQPPIGAITSGIDGPEGLSVDKNGVLYVANAGNNTVTVYPAGATAPSITYSQGLTDPSAAIVDSQGNLWVSTRTLDGSTEEPAVVEYPPGSTVPSKILPAPGYYESPMPLAFDQQGYLYAFNGGATEGWISKLAPGASSWQTIYENYGLRGVVGGPGGLAVDSTDTIVASNSGIQDFDYKADDGLNLITQSGQVTAHRHVHGSTGNLVLRADQTYVYAILNGGAVYRVPYPFTSSTRVTKILTPPASAVGIAISNGQTF